MKYFPIEESCAYELLDEAYNPPLLTTIEDDEFCKEWHATRDALKLVLDQFGEWNAYEEGDYYLPDVANPSRVIPVALTSHKMVSSEVLIEVVRFLRKLKEGYRVDLAISSDYDYLLSLANDGVRGWCSKEIELKTGLERAPAG